MLVTSKFVFIHIPKTAGKFVRNNIERLAGPVLYRGGFHDPIMRLPAAYHGLPVMAFVRNPWDWYVSWYYHMLRHGGFNPLFANAMNSGVSGFVPVMHYIFDSLDSDTEASLSLDRYVAARAEASVLPFDLNRGMIATMRDHGVGVLGWRYLFNLGLNPDYKLMIGRYENLHDDFFRIMSGFGVDVDTSDRRQIEESAPVKSVVVPHVNVYREHNNYQYYYSDESLAERVAQRERKIIDAFNYSF